MNKTVDVIKEELADRESIRDCIYRYFRGCDRREPELIESTFWPEATTDYGPRLRTSSAQDFMDKIIPLLGSYELTAHMPGSILIDVNGDEAYVEVSHHSWERARNEAGERYERFSVGRFLDRYQRRNAEWRLLSRRAITDLAQDFDATDVGEGRRKPDDPSYEYLKSFCRRKLQVES